MFRLSSPEFLFLCIPGLKLCLQFRSASGSNCRISQPGLCCHSNWKAAFRQLSCSICFPLPGSLCSAGCLCPSRLQTELKKILLLLISTHNQRFPQLRFYTGFFCFRKGLC